MPARVAAETAEELVVLLDSDNRPIGTMAKRDVHHAATPYHYAFSCYLFDARGENVLLTRRALSKATWPGVWTNSFCGHPAPAESLIDAALRRAGHELGITPTNLSVEVADYSYRAVDVSGVIEHEFCPILTGVLAGDPEPNPTEVCDWAWVPWHTAQATARTAPMLLSPWAAEQIRTLSRD